MAGSSETSTLRSKLSSVFSRKPRAESKGKGKGKCEVREQRAAASLNDYKPVARPCPEVVQTLEDARARDARRALPAAQAPKAAPTPPRLDPSQLSHQRSAESVSSPSRVSRKRIPASSRCVNAQALKRRLSQLPMVQEEAEDELPVSGPGPAPVDVAAGPAQLQKPLPVRPRVREPDEMARLITLKRVEYGVDVPRMRPAAAAVPPSPRPGLRHAQTLPELRPLLGHEREGKASEVAPEDSPMRASPPRLPTPPFSAPGVARTSWTASTTGTPASPTGRRRSDKYYFDRKLGRNIRTEPLGLREQPRAPHQPWTPDRGTLLAFDRPDPFGLPPRRGGLGLAGAPVRAHAFTSNEGWHDAPKPVELPVRPRSAPPRKASCGQLGGTGSLPTSGSYGSAGVVSPMASAHALSPRPVPRRHGHSNDTGASGGSTGIEKLPSAPSVASRGPAPSRYHQRPSGCSVVPLGASGTAEAASSRASKDTPSSPASSRRRPSSASSGASTYHTAAETRTLHQSASTSSHLPQAAAPFPHHLQTAQSARRALDLRERLRLLQGPCQRFESAMFSVPSDLALELNACVARLRELDSDEQRLRSRAAILRAHTSDGPVRESLDQALVRLAERLTELEYDIADAQQALRMVPSGLRVGLARTETLRKAKLKPRVVETSYRRPEPPPKNEEVRVGGEEARSFVSSRRSVFRRRKKTLPQE